MGKIRKNMIDKNVIKRDYKIKVIKWIDQEKEKMKDFTLFLKI